MIVKERNVGGNFTVNTFRFLKKDVEADGVLKSLKNDLKSSGFILYEENIRCAYGKSKDGIINHINPKTGKPYTKADGVDEIIEIPYRVVDLNILDIVVFKDSILQNTVKKIQAYNIESKANAFNKINSDLECKRFVVKADNSYYVGKHKLSIPQFNSLYECNSPTLIYTIADNVDEKYFIMLIELVERSLNETN